MTARHRASPWSRLLAWFRSETTPNPLPMVPVLDAARVAPPEVMPIAEPDPPVFARGIAHVLPSLELTAEIAPMVEVAGLSHWGSQTRVMPAQPGPQPAPDWVRAKASIPHQPAGDEPVCDLDDDQLQVIHLPCGSRR